MKCGMTWKEFSAISKSVFVETATDEYGIRGRPTNISRVSVLTGISRKEIKRRRHRRKRVSQFAQKLDKATVSERIVMADKLRGMTPGGQAIVDAWELEKR